METTGAVRVQYGDWCWYQRSGEHQCYVKLVVVDDDVPTGGSGQFVTDDPCGEALEKGDPEYHDALVTMRQGRKGRIDDVIDETAGGSGDLPKGKGKKNGKGKSSFRGGSGAADGGGIKVRGMQKVRPRHVRVSTGSSWRSPGALV